MTDDTTPHVPTLMTVHAHPDDETIGTGGTMARYVAQGRRVILVTCTRGEMGEIVHPELDTPDNHRRLAELRAVELERAMGALGVTEWENLGYHDSDMMGRPGNHDPRTFWQADLDDAARRLVWMIRRYQPDVVTMYNSFGGYGHPDHIRVHDVTLRAFPRAGDPGWYPEQLAEFEAYMAKMLVPDESITTWVDISGDPLQRKWDAIHEHRTQISDDSTFMLFGLDGWREAWFREAYILRESSVPTDLPETDLFAGLG